MDRVSQHVSLLKQLYLKFRSLKTIPFRTEFFVGYDLSGNTYWEFYPDRRTAKLGIRQGPGAIRPRRKYMPSRRRDFTHDYYASVPVQWLQWLRFTRPMAPTLQELVGDEQRKAALQQMVKQKELQTEYDRSLKESYENQSLNEELQHIKDVSKKMNVSLGNGPQSKLEEASPNEGVKIQSRRS